MEMSIYAEPVPSAARGPNKMWDVDIYVSRAKHGNVFLWSRGERVQYLRITFGRVYGTWGRRFASTIHAINESDTHTWLRM